jgi:hypothetical protein
LAFAGCRKNPIEKLSNTLADGALPQSSGTFVLYDDEVKTGGGAGFIPGGENQSISFDDQASPEQGYRDIRYIWSGADVMGSTETEHLFAGFSMLVSPDFTAFNTTPARDLSAPGYTSVKLFVKGSLSTGTTLRVEGPSTGASNFVAARIEPTLTSDWQEVTLPIPASDFSRVKVFLTVSLQYAQPPRTTAPGNGGVVYLDNIRDVK